MGHSKILRIATLAKHGLSTVNETSTKNAKYGSPHNILAKILLDKLKFVYTFIKPDDGEFGILLPDGNWTGMAGMIQHQEADLIIDHFSITEERTQIIDFSYPFYIDHAVFARNKSQRSVSFTSFLMPFSLQVWMSLLLCVFTLPIVYRHLFHRSRPLLYACKMLLGSSPGHTDSVGERVLRISWKVMVMLFSWSYVAVLLSFLILPPSSGVRTILELSTAVRDGRYECVGVPGSAIPRALIKSGGYLKIIGENLYKNNGSLDIQQVLLNTKSSKMIAYITAESYVNMYEEIFFISEDVFLPYMIAIGMRKGFCCKRRTDSIISRIWASGIFLKLMENSHYRAMHSINNNLKSMKYSTKNNPLSVLDVLGAFILLACGHFLALVVLISEILLSRILRFGY